jgi:hypothetical protein
MSQSSSRCPIPPVPVEVYSTVLADIFANVWNSCGSSDEAAERLGMPLDTVLGWMWRYRGAGVAVKLLPREENRIGHLVIQVTRLVERSRRGRTRLGRKARR